MRAKSTRNRRGAGRRTDGTAHFTPGQTACRWAWHVESVRRMIRQGRIGAIGIGGRLLIPISEIERIEREGSIRLAATALPGVSTVAPVTNKEMANGV